MRIITFLAVLLAASAAQAAEISIVASTSFLELRDSSGNPSISRIEPSVTLHRGDCVVTILSWDAPPPGIHLATSQVPAGLALQSTSRQNLRVSVDGGQNWRQLDNARHLPPGITHIRWPLGDQDGRLTYRAIVR